VVYASLIMTTAPESDVSMTDLSMTDRAVTAVTHDGAFRVIALRATRTVSEALGPQRADGANAQHLAEVLSGTILVRLTMAPSQRVQGIIRGAGNRGTLLGDSHPDGTARALLQRPAGLTEVSLARGAIMQMNRTLPTGAVHQGMVEVPGGGVSGALMSYFQASEQIECVACACATFETGGELAAAGGFVVQLLPEVSRAPLAVMTERLAHDFADPAAVLKIIEGDPAALLREILFDMPYVETQQAEVRFGCQCSSVRVLASLATLPKADIRELMESDEQLSISCDYCGQNYELSPKALAGLLSSS
jgi:molecular chaperone Hsp33